MNRISDFLGQYIGLEPWVVSLIAIAIATLVANQIAQLLLRQASRVTARTAAVWDDALVHTASRPVLVALWVIGLSFMARVVQTQVEFEFVDEVGQVREVALIVCACWFLLRFIGKVSASVAIRHSVHGHPIDLTTVDALSKLGRLVTLIVAILMVAQTVGFEITGLLALGGVGGIAVGFAAKDLLANFFGGLTIYMDRPFVVGEWIRSPDKELEGTVEHISWRHTRIRAFNRNPIYVPNSVFTNIVVENPSRMSHRRLKTTIGLRYEDLGVVEPIVADIRAMMAAHPGIDTQMTLIVNFTEYAASSLDLLIYAFTKTVVWTEFHAVKQDVLLKIGQIILSHGADIAFPTQTVYLHRDGAADVDDAARGPDQPVSA